MGILDDKSFSVSMKSSTPLLIYGHYAQVGFVRDRRQMELPKFSGMLIATTRMFFLFFPASGAFQISKRSNACFFLLLFQYRIHPLLVHLDVSFFLSLR
jgi:hypothetical protein